MTDETTRCAVCGNPMLIRTAEKYDGKCIPCAKGYREDLEQSRLFHEEQQRREKNPDVLFWRSLCKRVDNPALGFNSLPPPEKQYFAVCLLAGEINNGGFEQFFTNSYSDYFEYALLGLEKMGDELASNLTQKAKRLLFNDMVLPDRKGRLDYLESTRILDMSDESDILDELDAAFVKNYQQELSIRLTRFALKNGFWEET